MTEARLMGSAVAALFALACGDRVLTDDSSKDCHAGNCGGGGQGQASSQASVGGRGAGSGAVPPPWPDDDDLEGVLDRVEVPDEHDLLCVACSRPLGEEQGELIAFSMERLSVVQPPFMSTRLASLQTEAQCLRPSFEVRDGFAYGCDPLHLWRAELVTGAVETIPYPCRAMTWVGDELWLIRDEAEYGEVERYASWDAAAQNAVGVTLDLDLDHPIEQLDHEEGERAWTTNFGSPDLFARFDLSQGASPLRRYQLAESVNALDPFDALAAQQTVFQYAPSGALSIGVFSHQTGSIQATALAAQPIRTLHCWTR